MTTSIFFFIQCFSLAINSFSEARKRFVPQACIGRATFDSGFDRFGKEGGDRGFTKVNKTISECGEGSLQQITGLFSWCVT